MVATKNIKLRASRALGKISHLQSTFIYTSLSYVVPCATVPVDVRILDMLSNDMVKYKAKLTHW